MDALRGPRGLADTLAAARATGLAAALTAWRTTLNGIDVSMRAAADVLDSALVAAWTAGPDTPGMASTKGDPGRLLQAVRQEAQRVNVVAVMLSAVSPVVGP